NRRNPVVYLFRFFTWQFTFLEQVAERFPFGATLLLSSLVQRRFHFVEISLLFLAPHVFADERFTDSLAVIVAVFLFAAVVAGFARCRFLELAEFLVVFLPERFVVIGTSLRRMRSTQQRHDGQHDDGREIL